jgi:hypothetical protein
MRRKGGMQADGTIIGTTQVAQIAYVQQILFATKNTKSTKGAEKRLPD